MVLGSIVVSSLVLGFILFLIRKFVKGGRCYSTKRLDGKTVVITGANTGIGKETAKDLAKRGAKVILACRNSVKAQKAVDEVIKCSGNTKVSCVQLDLASFSSIRACAEKINAEEARLDILINNAGIMMCPHWKTEDGFEMQMGTNHFGHFLFTLLLLDLVKSSSPSKIINVASLGHIFGKIDFEDISWEKRRYESIGAYGQSKLANILFTKQLARLLEGTSVTTYAVHPGPVATELTRHFSDTYPWAKFIIIALEPVVAYFFTKTPEEGAQTSIYCAVDEKAENETGLYYSECKVTTPSRNARNMEDAKKLWDLSMKLCGLEN